MILIKNGTIHIGNGKILKETDILIEDEKIKKIGKNLNCEQAKIIDATGKEIYPGFIDPVCSIGAMGIPTSNTDNGEKSNPIVPEMNIRYSMDPDELTKQEFYRSGITTVGLAPNDICVMGGQIAVYKSSHMKNSKRMLKEKVGLKCSVTSAPKEYFGEKKMLPMTKMGIFYLLEKSMIDTIKADETKLDDKQKEIKKVLDGSLPIFCAAAKKSEIQGAIQVFKDIPTPITLIDAFCFEHAIEEIKQSEANLILGSFCMLSQHTKHDIHLEKLQEIIDNGNLISITTTCSGHSEGREIMLWNAIDIYRSGIESEEIVKMLTLNGAKILGVDDRVGSIEEGKDADISIFTADAIASYKARVETSIINGEVVYDERAIN